MIPLDHKLRINVVDFFANTICTYENELHVNVVHYDPTVFTVTICPFYNAQTQTLSILFLRWLQATIFKCEVLSMCPCWPSTMAFLRLWPPTATPTWAVKTLTNASLSSQKPGTTIISDEGECEPLRKMQYYAQFIIRYASVFFLKNMITLRQLLAGLSFSHRQCMLHMWLLLRQQSFTWIHDVCFCLIYFLANYWEFEF